MSEKKLTRVAISSGQRRLWTLDQLEGPSATYNIPQVLHLQGKLEIEILNQALLLLIARHESLRTVIRANKNGSPIGLLLPAPNDQSFLTQIDLRKLDAESRELALSQCIRDEVDRPFDLANDYSLRARVVRVDALENVLLLTFHHQASDGESAVVFARELSQAYGSLLRGAQPDWAPLPIQYSDWAAWQQQTLEGNLEQKIARAKARLADAPESLSLPLDHPRQATRARRAGYLSFELSVELTQALSALAVRQGATLFALLLGAYGATLARIANQSTVVIGSPVSGRSHVETESLIGFLVNTLAIPVSIDATCDGIELIARAKKSVEEALIDQDLPFERLVDGLGVERSLSQTPVFQASFTFAMEDEIENTGNVQFEGMNVKVLDVIPNLVKNDLSFYLTFNSQRILSGVMAYDADLFEEASVNNWRHAFESFLIGLVKEPNQSVLTLPLLNESAYQAVITQSAGEIVEVSESLRTLPALFESQVRRDPHATALMFEEQQVSYGELDRRSNQLARYLIKQGVGPDLTVAVLLDRSIEMMVAMLAVLKAGGVYLPLDPNYPSERLAFILNDAKASVMIADQANYDLLELSQSLAIEAPALID
ncbi:condensation domain-containing protein, partial [Zwartia panacis]|uniref:condensation domain-containing protein n=1 Tax=Zwartia panacis TaxID=2683345 RepID=UPI0025B3750E